MSGGSLNYVYTKVHQALEMGEIDRDSDEATAVDDVADLLRTIEWSTSGDYARDEWRDAIDEFARKWLGGERTDGVVIEVDTEIEDAIDLDALAFQEIGEEIVTEVGEPDEIGDLPESVRLRGHLEIVEVGDE